MNEMQALVLSAWALAAWVQPSLPGILDRVSEEAEVFRHMAPQSLAEETLEQRALKAPPRFRPRIGAAAARPLKPTLQARQIISEYSIGTFKTSPDVLHEFRQVVSVDGRPIASPEKARHALALGLRSEDDRARKRMMEDFEHHGLSGTVSDFGILLLAFGKRTLANYRFEIEGESRIGAERVLAVRYAQIAGPDLVTTFLPRRAEHIPMQGRIFVREPDGLPLRITVEVSRKEDNHTLREEATVDYTLSAHGFLTPAAVVHREFLDDNLLVENLFRYAAFKRFSADAEIRFTEVPEPPQ